MKRRPSPSPLAYLLNSYNGGITLYLVLRVVFASRWWWLGLLHTFAFWLFLPLSITTAIALILRQKRTAMISFILLVAGMIRFAPLPVGLITASDEPHDLRVSTFNLWNINPQIETSIDWVLAQDADVLILQELVEDNLSQIPRLLAVYPHQAFIEGSVQVFSRYHFLEHEAVRLENAGAEWDARRAVRVVIDVNGRAVTVYGVHLFVPKRMTPRFNLQTDIDTLDLILRYDERYRNPQIVNLAELVQTETNPVIIAGDFNTSHTSPVLNHLFNAGMRDVFRTVGTGWGMTWSHNPPTLPLLRIDHIQSSSELRPLRLYSSDFIGSDHLPLVADFAFVD